MTLTNAELIDELELIHSKQRWTPLIKYIEDIWNPDDTSMASDVFETFEDMFGANDGAMIDFHDPANDIPKEALPGLMEISRMLLDWHIAANTKEATLLLRGIQTEYEKVIAK